MPESATPAASNAMPPTTTAAAGTTHHLHLHHHHHHLQQQTQQQQHVPLGLARISVVVCVLLLVSIVYIASLSITVRDVTTTPRSGRFTYCKTMTSYTIETGLGNQMFAFASSLAISLSLAAPDDAQRCLCIDAESVLRQTFQSLADWPTCSADNNSDSFVYTDPHWGRFDDQLVNKLPPDRDIVLANCLQSWRYFDSIDSQLRRLFRFSESVERRAVAALDEAIGRQPASTLCPRCHGTSDVTLKIGVHVRRGDYLTRRLLKLGFAVADAGYLARSMDYFDYSMPLRPGDRLVFIVVSNDIDWCRRHVPVDRLQRRQVVFVSTGSTAVDLAVLGSCDHTIMTSGTYSWWAAWLANGTAVYYGNHPRPGSLLALGFNPPDYYKPQWIAMT